MRSDDKATNNFDDGVLSPPKSYLTGKLKGGCL